MGERAWKNALKKSIRLQGTLKGMQTKRATQKKSTRVPSVYDAHTGKKAKTPAEAKRFRNRNTLGEIGPKGTPTYWHSEKGWVKNPLHPDNVKKKGKVRNRSEASRKGWQKRKRSWSGYQSREHARLPGWAD